jgi:hypothetical protein
MVDRGPGLKALASDVISDVATILREAGLNPTPSDTRAVVDRRESLAEEFK